MRRFAFWCHTVFVALCLTVIVPPIDWSLYEIFACLLGGYVIFVVIPAMIGKIIGVTQELFIWFPYESYHYYWTKSTKKVPWVVIQYREYKALAAAGKGTLEEQEVDRKLAEQNRKWHAEAKIKKVITDQRKAERKARRQALYQDIKKKYLDR